jgi:hypothetical protein
LLSQEKALTNLLNNDNLDSAKIILVRGEPMETTTARDVAIAKLRQLPADKVLKVLDFMAGLKVGVKLNEAAKSKKKE